MQFPNLKKDDLVVVEGLDNHGPVLRIVDRVTATQFSVRGITRKFMLSTGVGVGCNAFHIVSARPVQPGDNERLEAARRSRRCSKAKAALATINVTPANLEAVEAFIKEQS